MKIFRRLILILLVVVVLVFSGLCAITEYSRFSPFTPGFFEKKPPVIAWLGEPKGLGGDPKQITLHVTDDGAGIDELVVRINQKNIPKELLRKEFTERTHETGPLNFMINPKELSLREGRAIITASAFDKSLWSNGSVATLELPVSFIKPHVDILTPQQNATLGGSELVFFRFVGKDLTESGVKTGIDAASIRELAQGVSASGLDAGFKTYPNIYFALFPIPLDYSTEKPLKVFARDMFGNSEERSFHYRIRNTKLSQAKIELTDDFLTRKVSELSAGIADSEKADKDRLQTFALINESLRSANEKAIRELVKLSNPACLWRTPFIRPLAASPKAVFGESRAYLYKGQKVTDSVHMGIDLADVAGAKVTAAQSGKVLFAGDLGIYGQTVLLDHGCGVSSLYAHLSRIDVQVEHDLRQGDLLGTTGATGLAGGDHLHFEIRVHGEPVSPFEWWDPVWMKDHIEQKIRFVQQELIGTPGE